MNSADVKTTRDFEQFLRAHGFSRRRAAALRAQQAEQMEAKTRADEARDKSFAKDALKVFGIRA